MAYLGHIAYDAATDPKAYFAQGLQNYLGGLNQQLESRRFGKALTESDSPALQELGQLVLGGRIPPQQAIAMSSLMQKLTPTIEQLRAQKAVETGAEPGTREFEDIAEGPEKEERITYKDAQGKTRMIRAPESELPTVVDQIIEEGGSIDTAKSTLSDERLNLYKEAMARGDKEGAELALYGKPMVEIKLGQPASPAERKEIAETRASMDALDNLKTLFDNTQTKTGPIVGRYSPIAGLVGMTTDEQEAFMAATSAFKNAIIKEITGAQMSEVEANRIMKQVPDITDPATRWKAKWEESKKNLEFLQKRRMEILEQSGIRVPGKQDEIPDDIKGMSDEELRKLAGIE